jgi:hypothetical protein
MAKRRKPNEDQPQDNSDNINDSSDDTFGLPEIEYEPLKREEERPAVEADPVSSESTASSIYARQEDPEPEPESEEHHASNYPTEEERYAPDYSESEESSSAWPRILGIAALLLIAGAGIWYFGFYRPEQEEKERIENERIAHEEADRKKHEEELAEQRRLEAERRRADSLANVKPAIGTIETLNSPSGRYFVIVASGVDVDLIMDYAKKLSPKGVSSKVIPPHGKVKFYRLAVAEGDTYTSTQSTADAVKGDYPEGAWVIKY